MIFQRGRSTINQIYCNGNIWQIPIKLSFDTPFGKIYVGNTPFVGASGESQGRKHLVPGKNSPHPWAPMVFGLRLG